MEDELLSISKRSTQMSGLHISKGYHCFGDITCDSAVVCFKCYEFLSFGFLRLPITRGEKALVSSRNSFGSFRCFITFSRSFSCFLSRAFSSAMFRLSSLQRSVTCSDIQVSILCRPYPSAHRVIRYPQFIGCLPGADFFCRLDCVYIVFFIVISYASRFSRSFWFLIFIMFYIIILL